MRNHIELKIVYIKTLYKMTLLPRVGFSQYIVRLKNNRF
jgi:hypothetical protein